jgi:hypothetical protein
LGSPSIKGNKHTKPPKNYNHNYNLSANFFFGNVWTSHLGLLFFKKVCLINLKLNLINYFLKFNKQWNTWMYGVDLWQNNTCHRVWKNCVYISKLKLWMESLGEFFYGVWYWYTWIKSRTSCLEI